MGGDYKGARFSGKREMFPAICDKCGAACSVPFKPSGDKPVYCSNCFEKTDSRGGQDRRQDSGVRRYGGYQANRSSSYSGANHSQPRDTQSNGMGMQLELLNTKLDQIITLLKQMTPINPEKAAMPEKSVQETVAPKKAKKTKTT